MLRHRLHWQAGGGGKTLTPPPQRRLVNGRLVRGQGGADLDDALLELEQLGQLRLLVLLVCDRYVGPAQYLVGLCCEAGGE